MKTLRLVAAGDAEGRAELLRAAGWQVDQLPITPEALKGIDAAVVVIDLSRRPAHGRDVALALRSAARTRGVPLLIVGGAPEKVDALRALLPDAAFAAWADLPGAVDRAIAEAPSDPVRPPTRLAGYSGTPLPKKLGLKPGGTLALVDAPDGLEAILAPLPEGAAILSGDAAADIAVYFLRSAADLRSRLPRMVEQAAAGGLWMAWPKKASGLATDLTETIVRAEGLAAGLVDFKVCAIDATWSGLRFSVARRP